MIGSIWSAQGIILSLSWVFPQIMAFITFSRTLDQSVEEFIDITTIERLGSYWSVAARNTRRL